MIKRIIKVAAILAVLVLVSLKVASVWNVDLLEEDGSYGNIPSTKCCMALDYHRVRSRSFWNTFLEKTVASDELVNYSIYTDEFEEEIQRLKNAGAYFATLEEVEEFRKNDSFPDKCVWISFDDGDDTLYKNAYPILKENNIPFTVFVIAGQVGNKDFNNQMIVSWDQLREMRDSGLVSFGSHTYNMHYFEDDGAKFLSKNVYDDFFKDIKLSREVLEEELDVEIKSIAYPFGESSDALADLSEKAGFESGYILAPYPIKANNDDFFLNRYMVSRKNFDKIYDAWINNN
ncbi:intercellular adhesin biosynthesis polysaccharide N-deacetylase [Clostridium sp. DSM 8431]|uniref:polysaccharide deacetylase family protein n=1 Tax=Clostridium sp. DSM 8431 TaxID=1761781 RepID=UPI0008E47608|nr:polysaccharide deacetylase family protein [Clostridium sp. DSM 8431]SFU32125.1 intercellular adhesin biosynthesis polysaccharide N-deacetylase [Clostridium sp. DSM 8431]